MKRFSRLLVSLVLGVFIFTTVVPSGNAAEIFLPPPSQMLQNSLAFTPVIIKGLVIDPQDPLRLDFLMDTGTNKPVGEDLRQEAEKSIKYFLASLTVDDNDQWVNLSPDEKDRVVPEAFGQTVMGRDLLGEDYVLKQLASSLLYPEHELGKTFWAKVYAAAAEKYGKAAIDVSNFNRVWIAPAEAQVWEHNGKVVILKSRLKVMLETDYLALTRSDTKAPTSEVDQVMREILIPALEQEVNEGSHFARLRQIYAAMILSAWYKERLKESLLSQAYADKNKIAGVEFNGSIGKEQIYQQYLESVKKGTYNYIKEVVDPLTGAAIPRKYFSGGFKKGNFFKELFLSGALVVSGALATLAPEAQALAAQFSQSPDSMVRVVAGVGAAGQQVPTDDLELVLQQWRTVPVKERVDAAMNGRAVFNRIFLAAILTLGGVHVMQTEATGNVNLAPFNMRQDQGVSEITRQLLSVQPADQLAALNSIQALGASGAVFIPEVVSLYRRLDAEGRAAMGDVIGEALLAIGGPAAAEGYSKLMRAVGGSYDLSFLRFIRQQNERGDNIIPTLIERATDENEEPQVRVGFWVSLLYVFDQAVDPLMQGLALDRMDVSGAVELIAGVLEHMYLVADIEPVIERARGRFLNYLVNGTSDQKIISVVFLTSIRPVNPDTREKLQNQLSSEVDPEVKAIIGQGLELFNLDPAQVSDKQLGGIDMNRNKLDLQIKRDGKGTLLPVGQQDWSSINILGFRPVIYRIEPVNMGLLLGLQTAGVAPDPV